MLATREGMVRPYVRLPSSPIQSKASAVTSTSALASARTLPCSSVMMRAIESARSRINCAARARTRERSSGVLARHSVKPRSAAASARSRSSFEACGRAPRVFSVAGLMTSSETPVLPWHHAPSINSSSFSYMPISLARIPAPGGAAGPGGMVAEPAGAGQPAACPTRHENLRRGWSRPWAARASTGSASSTARRAWKPRSRRGWPR